MKAIGIIWGPASEFSNEILSCLSLYCSINEVIKLDIGSSYIDLIKEIYPYDELNSWKRDYKINALLGSSSILHILFLDIPVSSKEYVERKHCYIYKEVEFIKSFIRSKFKSLISGYKYDNIFHLTDDELEYSLTFSVLQPYIISCFMDNRLLDIFVKRETVGDRLDSCNRETVGERVGKRDGDRLDSCNRKRVGERIDFCDRDRDRVGVRDDNRLANRYSLIYGKRDKLWFFDNYFLLKSGRYSESLGEYFVNRLCHFLGISCANCHLGHYKNYDLLISSFNSSNMISGYDILSWYYGSNNLEFLCLHNNILELPHIIQSYFLHHKGLSLDLNYLQNSLLDIYFVDLLTIQSDRHFNNWCLLYDDSSFIVSFSPLFDNSHILGANKNLSDLLSCYSEPVLLSLFPHSSVRCWSNELDELFISDSFGDAVGLDLKLFRDVLSSRLISSKYLLTSSDLLSQLSPNMCHIYLNHLNYLYECLLS